MELYVHIPFCKRKCAYCAFKSVPSPSDEAVFDYLTALNREIELAGKRYSEAVIETIYLGGGTPSYLSSENLTTILDKIRSSFKVSSDAEITVECNPDSVTEDKLIALKSHGVNRLSLGVQSLFDDNLQAVGRVHDVKTAIAAMRLAGHYFDNLSADLILGLPYDTDDRVKQEVCELTKYVDHISVYLLSVESNTALCDKFNDGEIVLPDEDKQIDFIHAAAEELSELGFERYEYSNFARNGMRSRHNSGYWSREEYLGLGLNSSSYVKTDDGKMPLTAELRYKNTADMQKYLANAKSAENYPFCAEENEVLSPEIIREEKLMLGLRTAEGVDKNLLLDKKSRIESDLSPFFIESGDRYALNERGMDVMNFILSELI